MNFKKLSAPRLFLIVLIVLVALLFAISMFRVVTRSVFSLSMPHMSSFPVTRDGVGIGSGSSEPDYAYNYDEAYASKSTVSPSISPYPPYQTTYGEDAEEYEVTDYSIFFKERNIQSTCASVANLKQLTYVIFESASESEELCSYRFKVTHADVDRVLDDMRALDPDTLHITTYTIEPTIRNYSDEIDILKQKLARIETTLANAERSYDAVALLATNARDIDALAKIIESKITLIERMSNERIATSEALDRIVRYKETQLDKTKFAFFVVEVQRDAIVSFKDIKDSWNSALKQFVRELNTVFQNTTIGIALFILRVLMVALYFFLVLVIVKFGFHLARRVWNAL